MMTFFPLGSFSRDKKCAQKILPSFQPSVLVLSLFLMMVLHYRAGTRFVTIPFPLSSSSLDLAEEEFVWDLEGRWETATNSLENYDILSAEKTDAEVLADSSLSSLFPALWPTLPPGCQPCWPVATAGSPPRCRGSSSPRTSLPASCGPSSRTCLASQVPCELWLVLPVLWLIFQSLLLNPSSSVSPTIVYSLVHLTNPLFCTMHRGSASLVKLYYGCCRWSPDLASSEPPW